MAKVITWVIYVLKNPRTNEIRYVGWTSVRPQRRLTVHIHEAVYKPRKNYRDRWISSLVSTGLKPLMEIVESGIGDGYNEAERRWIAHYRINGARLVNATEGGEGCLGRIASAATREKLKASPEKRAKMSVSQKARAKPSAETRANISAGQRKRLAAMTPEELSARSRNAALKYWAKKTPEERSALNKPLLEKSLAARPFVVSAESRAKMAAAKRNAGPLPPETRAKISAAITGMKRSPETRAKMSAARKRRVA
jgi:hypothetical protein